MEKYIHMCKEDERAIWKLQNQQIAKFAVIIVGLLISAACHSEISIQSGILNLLIIIDTKFFCLK